MTRRILDIAGDGARLRVHLGLLEIRQGDAPAVTVHPEEIGAVIVSNHSTVFTHAVLPLLAANGCAFLACDERCIPAAIMLPTEGHHLQLERLHQQIAAKPGLKKLLWKQLVQAKLHAQSAALLRLHGDDAGIGAMAARVKPGDPQNIEAQGARRYWPRLFADKSFRRDFEAKGRNAALNYGYGVLRAITTRAICGTGLHPSLGIHHANRYNAFALADDLMEPFRPRVDLAVAEAADNDGELTPAFKRALVERLLERVPLKGEEENLFEALARLAYSLTECYAGKRKSLLLPDTT